MPFERPAMVKILVVVPCGKAKIWNRELDQGPTEARSAYIGAPFVVNKTFAEKFADRWVVLSAKYGFIDPDFIIPKNYNVTFKDTSTHPISKNALKNQLKEKNLQSYDFVIALGGEDYSSVVKDVFRGISNVVAPAEGLPLGKAMAHINALLELKREDMWNRIGIS
jgi:hypothetical protein